MRNKLLVVALVVVGLASVAYAAFAQNLTIGGTGTPTGTWSVVITGITRTAATGATDATAPSFTGTSATFSTNLAYPGSTATYDVTVKNNGNIPAKLSTITTTPTDVNGSAPTYVLFNTSGVTAGTTTLAPGATNVMTVTVTWDAADSTSTTASKTATYTLNYIQNT